MPLEINRNAKQPSSRRGNTPTIRASRVAGNTPVSVPTHDRLTPEEASSYLWETYRIAHTVPTLATKRVRGGGPEYFKEGSSRNGRVTYSLESLDKYASELLRPRASTAEA